MAERCSCGSELRADGHESDCQVWASDRSPDRELVEAVARIIDGPGLSADRADRAVETVLGRVANSLGRNPDAPLPPEIDEPLAELIRAAEARGKASADYLARVAGVFLDELPGIEWRGKTPDQEYDFMEKARAVDAALASLGKDGE